MTGFALMLGKEAREQIRTARLMVVVAVFALFGLLSPVVARYTREIVEAVGGGQFGGMIPEPTVADAVIQLTKNVGQFGVVIAILVTMGAVAAEKERGYGGVHPHEAGHASGVRGRQGRRDRVAPGHRAGRLRRPRLDLHGDPLRAASRRRVRRRRRRSSGSPWRSSPPSRSWPRSSRRRGSSPGGSGSASSSSPGSSRPCPGSARTSRRACGGRPTSWPSASSRIRSSGRWRSTVALIAATIGLAAAIFRRQEL